MRRMRETIAARAAAGAAVILSSHLLHLVEELCTKLLVVRRGECVAYGTIDEIIAAHPELAGRSLEDVFLALTGDGAPTRVNALLYLIWTSARNRFCDVGSPRAESAVRGRAGRRWLLHLGVSGAADANTRRVASLFSRAADRDDRHAARRADAHGLVGVRLRRDRARVHAGRSVDAVSGAAVAPRADRLQAVSRADRGVDQFADLGVRASARRRSRCRRRSARISLWALFSTLNLHRLGAALVRSSWREHGGAGARVTAGRSRRSCSIGVAVLAGAVQRASRARRRVRRRRVLHGARAERSRSRRRRGGCSHFISSSRRRSRAPIARVGTRDRAGAARARASRLVGAAHRRGVRGRGDRGVGRARAATRGDARATIARRGGAPRAATSTIALASVGASGVRASSGRTCCACGARRSCDCSSARRRWRSRSARAMAGDEGGALGVVAARGADLRRAC